MAEGPSKRPPMATGNQCPACGGTQYWVENTEEESPGYRVEYRRCANAKCRKEYRHPARSAGG